MRMKCNQCQSEMIEDGKVNIQGRIYRIKIDRKGKETFLQRICKASGTVPQGINALLCQCV